jgi:hypothetical protein
MVNIFGRDRWRFGASGLMLLLILSAGCSSRGTVSGKVKVKDDLIRRGTVTFIALDQSWTSTVPIGEDGSYTIAKAPPGPVKISVKTAESKKQPQAKRKKRTLKPEDVQDEDLPARARNRLGMDEGASGPSVPKKYNDPETSGLTYEIKPGSQ